MSFTLFARKWGVAIAALVAAVVLFAAMHALSSSKSGGPQTARSSWGAQVQMASAERSSWS